MATQDQIDFFNENGYVVIPDFMSAECLESLRDFVKEKVASRIEEQVADAVARPIGVRMAEGMKKVQYYFKEGAIVDGKLTCEPKDAINMIGCCLHGQDESGKVIKQDKLLEVAKSVGFKAPAITFSAMYRADCDFPQKYFQIDNWMQMEPAGACCDLILAAVDSNASNGCFKVIKGSQKDAVNNQKMKINPEGTTWAEALKVEGDAPYLDGSQDDQFTTIDAPAGSLIVIGGLTILKIEAGDSETPASFIEAVIAETDGAKSNVEMPQ
jgi:ectoine hydroxylase-related dioxygenase (phytanoyl-CoA dioxygenase family)